MDWKVRFIDYPAQFQKMEAELMGTIRTVLSQGDLILRQHLRTFESNLAAFVGTRHAVGLSNCTDALHLTLRAAGVGPGDEVITVAHTFVATVAAIHHAGASPVLVDIGEDHNMDVARVEEAVSSRTKAIMPVHLNGRLSDMGMVMKAAEEHGLIVIEDSAQALGASLNGRRGGTFGLAGCFSFYPAKLLGAFGDAGAVVTSRAEIAERLRLLRNHGRTQNGDVAEWSFNCRMDNLHAAILDLKLKKLPEWFARRREIARLYHGELAGMPDVRLPPSPCEGDAYYDTFQNFEIEARDRDRLVAYLQERGVETLIPWGGKGVHQFKSLGLSHFRLPRTDQLLRDALLLPIHTELTDGQVGYVCESIREFYARR